MSSSLTIYAPKEPDVVTLVVEPSDVGIKKVVLPALTLTLTPPPRIRVIPRLPQSIRFETGPQGAPGRGLDPVAVISADAIGSSSFVSITPAGAVRACSASTGPAPAEGFVIAAAPISTPAMIYSVGYLNGLSGLIEGSTYYLGLVPGQITPTPDQSGMDFSQAVGVAVSDKILLVNIQPPIYLA